MEDFKRNIKVSKRVEFAIYQILDNFLKRRRVFKIFGWRRKVFNKKLYETVKKSGKGKVIEIERRKDLSLKEFREHYQKKGIPVIMEGAAKDWDCIKKWSFEYIKELHGADEVVVFKQNKGATYEVKTLHEILGAINSGDEDYLRAYPLLKRHPEHASEINTEWISKYQGKPDWYSAFNIFMGSKGTGTQLHIENKCNLFIQIYGEKKWILYPSYYTPIMDPPPIKGFYRTPVKGIPEQDVDLFNQDENYSSSILQYLDRYEATTRLGDVFWNPPFCWHTVKNTTNSIGVSYQWFNPFSAFKVAPLYMFLDLFQINPTLWKSLKRTTEDANMVILTKQGNLKKYFDEKKDKPLRNKAAS